MESPLIRPRPETLAKLNPLSEFNKIQLDLLAQSLKITTAPKDQVLLSIGDTENFSLYLLRGRLQLRSADDRYSEITESSIQASRPIANLIPRRYEVKTLSSVDYIMVDNQLLEGLVSAENDGITATEISSDDQDQNLGETESLLSKTLSEDLENDRLILPTLPDIALRVGQAMGEETTDAQKIAQIIQTDPAFTAKLIRAANSPLYGGVGKVDTCKEAVVRLGTGTTHKLVLTFALRELFNVRSPLLKNHMHQLWEHSIRVSAICYVLAKVTKQFNAEHALLAGLLHDIGVVAILSYAERFPGVAGNEQEINKVIQDMRGPVGAQILQAWGFTDDLVIVAQEAENWYREIDGPADFADLVVIAQLHCYIGKPRMKELPTLDQVPAFSRLDIGELSPRLSIKILDKAEEKIAQAESLLRA